MKESPESLAGFLAEGPLKKRIEHLTKSQWRGLIMYGPPGCGKTTLAKLLAKELGVPLYSLNAVLDGKAELKKIIARIEAEPLFTPILFIDEIHRFNKAQQDALLPYLEEDKMRIVGATTEKPQTSLNKAILSRVQLLKLPALSSELLQVLIDRLAKEQELTIEPEANHALMDIAQGDARVIIKTLKQFEKSSTVDKEKIEEVSEGILRDYDKDGNRHYDVISAFIKSMRGSDPQAATLWLAVMIDGGEDPVFIARRLVIFASEDIGNADPRALSLAVDALKAVESIGMPESRIVLSQVTNYLASTLKSNASYTAINDALKYVQNSPTIRVPEHLKNFNKNYKYPHSYPGNFVRQAYHQEEDLPEFYQPQELSTAKRTTR